VTPRADPADQAVSAELFDQHQVRRLSRGSAAPLRLFAERAPACWWDVARSHDFKFDADYRARSWSGNLSLPGACKQEASASAHGTDIDRTLEMTDEVLRMLARN